jgi:hypothetical protein
LSFLFAGVSVSIGLNRDGNVAASGGGATRSVGGPNIAGSGAGATSGGPNIAGSGGGTMPPPGSLGPLKLLDFGVRITVSFCIVLYLSFPEWTTFFFGYHRPAFHALYTWVLTTFT